MKNRIQKIFLVLFPFVISLPIPEIISLICLIIFFIGLLFDLKLSSLNETLRDKFVLISFLFFFTDIIGNIIRFDAESPFFRDIKLSFLIIPGFFLTKHQQVKKHFKLICNAFLFGVLGYVLYAWSYIVDFYLITSPNYKMFSLSDGYIVYQLYNYLPGAIHHTYIGIYMVFAILILLTRIIERQGYFYIYLILLLLFSFSLFYISGKSSFVLLFLLMTFYLLSQKIVLINILFAASFFGGLLLIKQWVTGASLRNSIVTRLEYYKCGLDILKEHFFTGIGASNFSKISEIICNTDIFLPHNMFLRTFVTNGILSLFILLTLLIWLLLDALKKKDKLYISLIIILIIGGLTEDLIFRQRGVMFFMFFISLFYSKNKDGINYL